MSIGEHEFHREEHSETNFNDLKFEVTGDVNTIGNTDDGEKFNLEFIPQYYPDRVTVGKERDLVREKSICMGEYVNDVGTKNREIHVTGKIITPELKHFHDLVELGEIVDLFTMPWAGEVMLEDSEIEGPIGVDVRTNHFMYEYTLDFVSTGRDELTAVSTGVISTGE